MKSTLLLRLAAPLQAWGTDSLFETRRTDRGPSKSGVIGLVAACMGLGRTDPLDRLAGLRFGTRADQPGKILRDFHVARGKKDTYITYRYYIEDAVFLAGLESEDEEFLDRIASALETPVFPPFLGRRSCPPVSPLLIGIRKTGLEEALEGEPWHAAPWWREKCKRQGKEAMSLEVWTECLPGERPSRIIDDLPVSFDPGQREYMKRGTVLRAPVAVLTGQMTEHDPMAVLPDEREKEREVDGCI